MSCAGGYLSYTSTDGTTAISASFTSGRYAEGCSGGGKGGRITCSYSLTGYFSGTLTKSGQAQAITGVTYQAFGTTGGGSPVGSTGYNSAYAPFYYSDTEQILRSDDLQGTNQITFGSQGSGVGQFYGAYGIALDSLGRIYVADTYNCRIVRMDDMKGTNWTTFGSVCGSGRGQFDDPTGIAVDSAGKIYVLDAGNCRVVRMNAINGAGWTTYGSAGSGTGQFSQYLQSLAVDASARIYIADTGNRRILRINDMTGTNWTALTQSPVVNGVSYSFQSPAAVTVDSAGKIYIADNESYQPAVIRVDDMTGANWTSVYTGASGLNSISVDSGGTVFAGGGGVRFIDGMATVLSSSGAIGPVGSYYVFGVTPVPVKNPRPSAIGFSPSTLDFTQNAGTSSSPSPITISNFGGSPLNVFSIAASGPFFDTPNCPGQLTAGANCTVNVTFSPTTTGPASGSLTVMDDSGNAGGTQIVTLTGTGTAPAASVTPTSLSFNSQLLGTTSNARTVTLQNTGTGPMQVTTVTAPAPFSETNTCSGSIAPGFSCTVSVTFTPTVAGSASASLSIAGNAGTQTVTLSGNGLSPVTFSSSTLNFGTLAVGNTSAAKTVTVTNRQNVPLTFTTIAASAGFAISSQTCGTSLAASASCTVSVTFVPAAIGAATGTLTFTDSGFNSPQAVNLTGTGSAPVTLSTSTLNFGTVTSGASSSAKSVTLTNHLNVSLSFSSIVASAGFTISSDTCSPSVAAGANCTVAVKFSPTATGAASGTLTFTDGAANSPQVVNLTGTGR